VLSEQTPPARGLDYRGDLGPTGAGESGEFGLALRPVVDARLDPG
jgi:hypothetical protein